MLLSRGAASSASASAIPFKPAQTNPRLNSFPRRPPTPHCLFLSHQLIPPINEEFSTSFDNTHTLHKQEQTWHFQAKVTALVVVVVAGITSKGLLLLLDIGAIPLLLPSKATAIPKDRLNTSRANTTLRNSSTTLPSKAMDMAAPLRSNNTNTSLPAPINNSPATVLRAGQAPLPCHKEHNSSDTEHHKAIRSSTVTVPESGRRC